MARQNVPFLSIGNRGLISPKALARVDLDRTRLSAEVFKNWIGKTQGALTIRPGTKYLGSSYADTGAEFLEFVASTDDVALLELTHNKMRVWLGDDAHEIALMGRPAVDTTVSITDTGWADTSTGGTLTSGSSSDVIPTMTGPTTNGVTITVSSENPSVSGGGDGYAACDDNNFTRWLDTGFGHSTLPSWLNVDFGADTGNRKAVTSYSLRASGIASETNDAPGAWRLITGNHDTGTYATDTGKWTLQDERSGQTGWSVFEKRTFTTDEGDTGTVTPRRHWRLYVTDTDVGNEVNLAEFELFTAVQSSKVRLEGGRRILNATALGTTARAEKRVIVSDTGTEHSLAIYVERGPVTLRVGSTQRDDDYIGETSLGTGYHNLALTPQGDFWITLQNDTIVDRIVGSISIGDSGTVEITTPWEASDIDNVRYDQSADVVYVDCVGVRPSKIERRGTGRSWSVVDYAPNNGPFLPAASSSAQLSVSHFFGNTTLNSSVPFFTVDHVGALVRIFHQGQSGQWRLGAAGAHTDPIKITGISDTGAPGADSERRVVFSVSGTWAGRITIQRSIDGDDVGFKTLPASFTSPSDTGTFTKTIDDPDDNVTAYYRAIISDTGTGSDGYTSGVAVVTATYGGGGTTGVARITDFNSNTSVGIEVLERFSDTGPSDNWQQGYWSEARGFPTAVALHGGRLGHAQGGSVFLSVSDDFESFDDTTPGDAGPIIRTLGSGPVDNIRYLVSLVRMIIGTAGAELMMKSSSLDEPLTPDNSAAVGFSTQGSSNLRAVKLDTRAIMVQRSGQRVFMIGPSQGNVVTDYEAFDLTLLVPDLLAAGVVSIAVQRQPDTRVICALADGTVGLLCYEPQEEVIAWFTWETDGAVEKVACLPGVGEDAVFFHVRRTINGVTKRYLEKWALESESLGDTGLSWIADCSTSITDTGRTTFLHAVAPHLAGENVVVWGSLDTGSTPHVDLSPDTGSDFSQRLWAVDTGGDVTLTGLTEGVHHAVVGLPYSATWKSTKLAYAAELGTALVQQKRVPQVGLVLYKTHHDALKFGSDTGALDPLPRVLDGATVDRDIIHETLDMVAVPMPDKWNPDIRLIVTAKAPRPATVLAAVPTVVTSEK